VIHEIKNQHGKHITEIYIRDEIINALENAKDCCWVDGVKIDIVKDFKTDGVRETIVNIEGI
jgi:hypothetical protein